MDPILCKIGCEFAANKGSLIEGLDKANTLVEELPPSSTKNNITQAILHVRAKKDLLHRASVTSGAASITSAVWSVPLFIPGVSGKKATKWRAVGMDPSYPKKNVKESEKEGESSQGPTQAEDDYDDNENKLFTGRPKCMCACQSMFPDAEQVEMHLKGVHLPLKTWMCTGKIKVNGKDEQCPEYFDAMWKHYRKVHLNLYRYMCNLKVDGKNCPQSFKMDEKAT